MKRALRKMQNPFIRSLLARSAVFPISALASFVTASIVVRATGSTTYGAITLITSLPSLIPFADLGVSASIINSFATSDPDRFALTRRAWRLLWCTIAALSVIVLTLAAIPGWNVILGDAYSASHISGRLVTCTALLFLAATPLAIGQRILVGTGRIATATLLQAITPVATLVVTVTGSSSEHQIAFYVLAPVVGQLIAATVTFTVASTLVSLSLRLRPGEHRRRRELRRRLLTTAAPMLLVMFGLPIALQSDRIVLSHSASPAALGAYSLAATLYAPAWSLVTTVGLNLWPRFAQVRSEGGRGVGAAYMKALTWLALLGGLGGAALVAAGPLVTRIWSGRSLIAPLLWGSLGALLLVQSGHLAAGMLLTRPKELWFQAMCVVSMVILNIPLSVLLALKLGAAGPALASAFAVLVCQALPGFVAARRADRGQFRSPRSGLPRMESDEASGNLT